MQSHFSVNDELNPTYMDLVQRPVRSVMCVYVLYCEYARNMAVVAFLSALIMTDSRHVDTFKQLFDRRWMKIKRWYMFCRQLAFNIKRKHTFVYIKIKWQFISPDMWTMILSTFSHTATSVCLSVSNTVYLSICQCTVSFILSHSFLSFLITSKLNDQFLKWKKGKMHRTLTAETFMWSGQLKHTGREKDTESK